MFIQLMNTTIWNLRVGNQNSEIMKWTGMLLLTCKICVWLVKTSTSRRLCNNHLYTVGFVANRGKLLHRLVFKCTRWLFKKCMHWISYDNWVEGKTNKRRSTLQTFSYMWILLSRALCFEFWFSCKRLHKSLCWCWMHLDTE